MVDVSLVHGGGCGDGVSDSGGGYDLKHLVNDLFPTALLTNMYFSPLTVSKSASFLHYPFNRIQDLIDESFSF